jgi:DnaJ like chaperone protein
LERGVTLAAVKKKHKALVRSLHPDTLTSKGVPKEMVKLATDRLARINVAYNDLTKELA